MTTSTSVECWLLYYVPNVLSEKTVAIAGIIIPSGDLEAGAYGMIHAADWQTKVRVLDPDADLQMLNALLSEIRDRLVSPSQRSDMIQKLEDSFSNVVQVAPARLRTPASSPTDIESFARGQMQKTSETSCGLTGKHAEQCEA